MTGRKATASTHSLHSPATEQEGCEHVARTRMDPETLDRQGPGWLRRKAAAPGNENGGPLTLKESLITMLTHLLFVLIERYSILQVYVIRYHVLNIIY